MSFENEDPQDKASDPDSPSTVKLDDNIKRLVHNFIELAQDHLELATLEIQLTVNTVLRMAVISMFTALLFASAWLGLIGSATLGLIGLGLPAALAMLLLSFVNLLLAIACWLRIRKMSHWLGWPATQRSINPPSGTEKEQGAL